MFLTIRAADHISDNCQQFNSVEHIHVAIRSTDQSLYNRVFSCLQMLFFPKTKRFVINHGGHEQDAWDVFQDVSSALLVRIKNKGKDLPVDDSGFGGYLMTIIKRTWYERFRNTKPEINTHDTGIENTADDADFLQLYEEIECARALEKALEELGDRDKEFIQLKYFQEKTYDEIEELTGRKAKVLKSNRHRIIDKLKNSLSKYL